MTLAFGGLLTSTTIYGTLDGGTLTLQVPQSNGTAAAQTRGAGDQVAGGGASARRT